MSCRQRDAATQTARLQNLCSPNLGLGTCYNNTFCGVAHEYSNAVGERFWLEKTYYYWVTIVKLIRKNLDPQN